MAEGRNNESKSKSNTGGDRENHQKNRKFVGIKVKGSRASIPSTGIQKGLKRSTIGGYSISAGDSKTKTMATMVPDEVIYQGNNYLPNTFDTALMFADVSGFTDLSEKFNRSGPGGASKLSQVLNFYIGNMVQEILSHGGDVLKFSGDAFLVLFKVNSITSIQDAIHEAIDTAITIQNNYGEYETEVGVTLRVKIAISAGTVYFSMIGTPEMSHYIVVGQPIWDAKSGEHLCSPGDIIVAVTAWQYVIESKYVCSKCADSLYFKIHGFSEYWRSVKKPVDSSLVDDENEETNKEEYNSEEELEVIAIKQRSTKYSLRKTITLALNSSMKEFMQRFMIPPLMRAIDINEPLEYLTEMREVVIVFINIVIGTQDQLKIISIVNKAFTALVDCVYYHEGVVNKVSLFDKDTMFLTVFGLRGFKHDLESQIALRCAVDIKATLSEIELVKVVSIGVTTGFTYCGVVGHSLRREYSVISITVNKAARLMMAYPDKVTCDRETFLGSRMDPKHFVLQRPKVLKGLHNVGPIYEFGELNEDYEDFGTNFMSTSIIGRDTLIERYEELLNECKENMGRSNEELITCFLIMADTQQGRTRVIQELYRRTSEREIKCTRINLKSTRYKKPHSTITALISNYIGLTTTMSQSMRQQILDDFLKEYNITDDLYVINSLFDVHFECMHQRLSIGSLTKKQQIVLENICNTLFDTFAVIFIDNIEFIDDEFLNLFFLLIESNRIFCAITINIRSKSITQFPPDNQKICRIKLDPIDVGYQTVLACRLLDVVAIPLELERIIHEKSNGNPGWIRSFLLSLRQSGSIVVQTLNKNTCHEQGLVLMDQSYIKMADFNVDWNKMFADCCADPMYDGDDEYELMKVVILRKDITKDVGFHLSSDAYNLITYDSLSSFEQLICKCAAVVGQVFLRTMVMFVMSVASEQLFALSIQKLFELHVFACCSGDFSHGNTIFQKNRNIRDTGELECTCLHNIIPEATSDLPNYANCGFIQFKSAQFHETVYNLLTDRQRKDFHERALMYLERETTRCDSCGGGFFAEIKSVYEAYDLINLTPENYNPLYDFSEKGQPLDFNSLLIFRTSSFDKDVSIFSQYDFTECTGEPIKSIKAQIQLAEICLEVSNITRAIYYLEEALTEIEAVEKRNDLLWPYLYGRTYTLRGQCYIQLQEYEKGLPLLLAACKVMGLDFDSASRCSGLTFWTNFQRVKNRTIKYDFLKRINFNESDIYSNIIEQLTSCLIWMAEIYVKLGNWSKAKVAAILSLNNALRHGNCPPTLMAESFATVLFIGYSLGFSKRLVWLQDKSLQLIFSHTYDITKKHLFAVAKILFCTVLCHTNRPNMETTVLLSKTILQISSSISSMELKSKVLPILADILMSNKRLDETVLLLTEIRNQTIDEGDRSGILWYYALCLSINLDTGYTIVTYEQCEQLYADECTTPQKIGDRNAINRFYANLWCWCVRREEWESASVWMSHVLESFSVNPNDPTVNVLTAMRILECYIILLVTAIDTRDVRAIVKYENEIQITMKNIEKAFQISKFHNDKYILYKTYYETVREFNLRKLNHLMKKGSTGHSKHREDQLYADILTHNIQYWKRELSVENEDFWTAHSDAQNRAMWTEFNQTQLIHPYSLPLPKVCF